MSKHASPTLVLDRQPQKPKHSTGWTLRSEAHDRLDTYVFRWPAIPAKHAKPFGKHHPATPVTAPAAVAPRKKKRTRPQTECRICNDLAMAA